MKILKFIFSVLVALGLFELAYMSNKLQTPSSQTLQSIAKKSENKVVVFYFGASWCGPCREIHPKIIEYSRQYNFELQEYDVDELVKNNDRIVQNSGLTSDFIPVIAVYKQGKDHSSYNLYYWGHPNGFDFETLKGD